MKAMGFKWNVSIFEDKFQGIPNVGINYLIVWVGPGGKKGCRRREGQEANNCLRALTGYR